MTAPDPAPTPVGRPLDIPRGVTLTRLDEFGEILVAAVGSPGPAAAALLSCRVHEAISAAGPYVSVVVDLEGVGGSDPVVRRVLRCARESAAARGVVLRIVGEDR